MNLPSTLWQLRFYNKSLTDYLPEMSESYVEFEPVYALAEDANWEANLLPFIQTAGVEDRG